MKVEHRLIPVKSLLAGDCFKVANQLYMIISLDGLVSDDISDKLIPAVNLKENWVELFAKEESVTPVRAKILMDY